MTRPSSSSSSLVLESTAKQVKDHRRFSREGFDHGWYGVHGNDSCSHSFSSVNSVLSVVKKRLNLGGPGEHGGPAVETTRVLSIPSFAVQLSIGRTLDTESAMETGGRAFLFAALLRWEIRAENDERLTTDFTEDTETMSSAYGLVSRNGQTSRMQ